RGFNRIAGTIQSRRRRRCDGMARWQRKCQRAETHCAIRTHGHYARAKKMLPLAESTRVALLVREELQTEHGVRDAIQCSGNRDVAIGKRSGCDYGIILQIVRASVGV